MTGARQAALVGLAAVAATAWLAGTLPEHAAGELRSTLVMLPLLVAAFRGLEVWGWRLGARKLWPQGEAWALVGWFVLAFQHPRLGLLNPEGLVAALGGGLLLYRAGRLLSSWGPLLKPRGWPPAVFFFLPLVVYLAVQPWAAAHRPPDGDEPYNLLLAHSLAHDFDIDLANQYREEHGLHYLERRLEPQPGDPRGDQGQIYSRHNMLLPLFLAFPTLLLGRWGAMACMAFLTAALAWMFLRLAGRYFPDHRAGLLRAYALFALAPPLLLYSHQIWVEVPAALLLVFALDRLRSLTEKGDRHALWGLAACLVLLPLLKLRFMPLVLSLLVLAAWRAPGIRRALAGLGLAMALGVLALGAVNQALFGNPFKLHELEGLLAPAEIPAALWRGALGTFFDSSFGLFAVAPLWLLILPAVVMAWCSRREVVQEVLLVALPYGLAVWPQLEWFGGWSPPFRYYLVCLPLLALLLVPWLDQRGEFRRPLVSVLLVASAVLTLVWLVQPAWTYNLAAGSSDLLDHLSERFAVDFGRLFPSYVRPQVANWGWLLVALALASLGLGKDRRIPGGLAAGGVLFCLALVTLAFVARGVPTSIVQAEDAWVVRERAPLVPEPWVVQRVRFTGATLVRPGGWLEAPVVPGGETVGIRLVGRTRGDRDKLAVEIMAGDQVLIHTTLDATRSWTTFDLGRVPWVAGQSLVLRVPATEGKGGLEVDRIELDWGS